MIKLSVLETGLREEEIFSKLVSRGRHADIPYYFSVDTYNWEEGYILFTRLDCAPAPTFKVGVSGNCLVVSQKDLLHVKSWLSEWNVEFKVSQTKDFKNPKKAQGFLRKLRKKALSSEERKIAGEKANQAILERNQQEDKELIARIG